MQSEDVRAFKNELRNYYYYLFRIASLGNAINSAYDRLGGVRGVDPSREPIHGMPDKDLEYELRDKIEIWGREKDVYMAKVQSIEQILNRIEIPVRDAIFRVYAKKEKTVKIADEWYMSPSGFKALMDRSIEKAIKKDTP